MKTTVTLETKDVREIIAKFLGTTIENVVPNRYSFGVANMSAEEIERKIKDHLIHINTHYSTEEKGYPFSSPSLPAKPQELS